MTEQITTTMITTIEMKNKDHKTEVEFDRKSPIEIDTQFNREIPEVPDEAEVQEDQGSPSRNDQNTEY